MKAATPEEVLTTAMMAEAANTSVSTVKRAHRLGYLKPWFFDGKQTMLWHVDQIDSVKNRVDHRLKEQR